MENNRFPLTATVAIILCSVVMGVTSNLGDPPNLLHQWRQCDGLSMSLNYFEEGLDFFNPQIHFQHSEEGRAVGEFPILYYANALLWKCFGHSHLVSRLLNLIIFLLGLLCLSLTSLKLTKDKFLSICVPLLVLSSPLIARYASAFLPNTTALSFLFISIYFYVKHLEENSFKTLLLCVVFGALSVLMRTTMLIGFLPLIVVSQLKKFELKKLILLVTPVFAVLIWVLFIKSYNEENGSVYFLTKITPIWEMSGSEISEVWDMFNRNIKGNLMSLFLFLTLIFLAVYSLINRSKLSKSCLVFFILTFLATVAYFLLWFKKLNEHDYYFVEFFILVPTILILYGQLDNVKKKYIHILLASVTAISIIDGATLNRFIQSPSSELNLLEKTVLKKSEVKYWTWFHDNYNSKYKAFETAHTFIRDLGIERDDVVFSIQDPSPNITLYFLDVKGYTALYQHDKSYDQQIKSMKERGVNYLITLDKSIIDDISEYLVGEHLGSYQNIDVFKIED